MKSGFLVDIPSGTASGILCGMAFSIPSGEASDIAFGIAFEILFGIPPDILCIWHSFWHGS